MADNFVSFSRFTALPTNIADFGTSAEEVRTHQGKPDKNPAASPMAAPARSRRALALAPAGSDDLRVAEPQDPSADPYEGPRSVLVLSRAGAKKLRHGVLVDLQEVVDGMPESDTRALMQDSFSRIAAMRDLLAERNEMTENIYMRALAASRS